MTRHPVHENTFFAESIATVVTFANDFRSLLGLMTTAIQSCYAVLPQPSRWYRDL